MVFVYLFFRCLSGESRLSSQTTDYNPGDFLGSLQSTAITSAQVPLKCDSPGYPPTSESLQPKRIKLDQRKTALFLSDNLECPSQSTNDLSHQSLIGIAKAAAMAMKRSCSLGSKLYSRGRIKKGQLPMPPDKTAFLQGDSSNDGNGNNECSSKQNIIATRSSCRNRVFFSPAQKQVLVAEFTRQPYPTSNSLRALAEQLNLPYKPVSGVFCSQFRINLPMQSPSSLLHFCCLFV